MKTVEIVFPWGGHFLFEIEHFMKECGLFIQDIDTQSDFSILAFSKNPFPLIKFNDSNTAKVSCISSDWKHLFLIEEEMEALKAVGITVDLIKNEEKNTYTATFKFNGE